MIYHRPTIHTPNIQRSHIKAYITGLILHHLYGKSEQAFSTVLRDIHAEQMSLLRSHTKEFLFRGKNYSWGINSFMGTPPELHPSLHERMQKYIDDYAQVFSFERPCVEGVLKAMFTHTEFLGDYHDLLPESLHKCFEGYTAMFASMDNKRFNTEQAIEFKERNERYLQLICNRMMMNILL